ncbi:MAG: hypothetical protein EBX35_15315 [Planctomycetia bacterium]|nr:hypothetical protein [Planctomycetia bacterium]
MEPEPEVVETEKPPVEDPVAAPVMVEEVADTGAGATSAATQRNVPIGSLLDGRQEGRRDALVRAFGGSDATEAAVAKALLWLAKQQRKDGLWSLQGPYEDGGSKENSAAATVMALLAFQGAGNTPSEGRHKAVVARAWQALLKRQLPDGQFDVPPLPSHHALYTHGQATYAICELFGMTKDRTFADPARRALEYALNAQGPNGGWDGAAELARRDHEVSRLRLRRRRNPLWLHARGAAATAGQGDPCDLGRGAALAAVPRLGAK